MYENCSYQVVFFLYRLCNNESIKRIPREDLRYYLGGELHEFRKKRRMMYYHALSMCMIIFTNFS